MANLRESFMNTLFDSMWWVKEEQKSGEYVGPFPAIHSVVQKMDGPMFIRFVDDTVLQVDANWLKDRDLARFLDQNDADLAAEAAELAGEMAND